MSRKKDLEESEVIDINKEVDSLKLSRMIIQDLNRDSEEKTAWCLATDLDNPTTVREFISTGSTILDYLIANRRNGGVAVGKLTEIVGEEASGKSLIAAHLIAETQRRGGIAIYIDTENAANEDFMKQVGVNTKEMVYAQPGTVEEVGDLIEKTIIRVRTKAPTKLVLIVWDSIAGTPPKAEVEGTYDANSHMGLLGKALALMMRKITQTLGKERICLVFCNQLKYKIGVSYGDPMFAPGGKAVPFHASTRVRLTRSAQLKEGKKKDTSDAGMAGDENGKGAVYGINTIAKVIKSRLGPPLRQCRFDITFAFGIDDVGSWYTLLHERGEITKSDGWSYLTSFKGKENVKHPDWGHMFRESRWTEEVNGNAALKEHVLNLLEKHLVVKYDAKEIKDLNLDPDSLMDVEAVADEVKGG